MLKSESLNRFPTEGKTAVVGKHEVHFLRRTKADITPERPIIPQNIVLNKTDTYMDIGAGHIDHDVIGAIRVVLYLMLIMPFSYWFGGADQDTLTMMTKIFVGLYCMMLVSIIGYYVVRRRRRTTVRFYQDTQHVVFKASPKGREVELKWCELVPYIKAEVQLGGAGTTLLKMDTSKLHLAWYDKSDRKLHTFYASNNYLMPMFSLIEWRLIERYMQGAEIEADVDYYRVPSSNAFRAKREIVWRNFVNRKDKRLLGLNIRDMSLSYFSVSLYYLTLLLGLWRLPYLLCDLYLSLAVTPFLPSHDTDTQH